MSEQSIQAFHKLVGAMRTYEKEYWDHRDKKILKQSIELEARVDKVIATAEGEVVPDNENGMFFLEVKRLRFATKEYFALKKEAYPDRGKIAELFKQIKASETKIDKTLAKFKDDQARKDGYIVEYHVMERRPCLKEAKSIYKSTDEHMRDIELNEYLRNAERGVMYFGAKKYVKRPGGKPQG